MFLIQQHTKKLQTKLSKSIIKDQETIIKYRQSIPDPYPKCRTLSLNVNKPNQHTRNKKIAIDIFQFFFFL